MLVHKVGTGTSNQILIKNVFLFPLIHQNQILLFIIIHSTQKKFPAH